MKQTSEKIAIIGLGYVGLPLAVALGNRFENIIGFDIHQARVDALKNNHDWTNETTTAELKETKVAYTTDKDALKDATFYIVAVPTPVDSYHRPDLTPLEKASQLIGPYLKKGDIVVFESTVYPGVTEEFCGPVLEKASGLKSGVDFFLGYSPERINPGDKVNTLETIVKIISAQDKKSLDRLAVVYGTVVKAGLHRAESIKVAEAAKVIENAQRDVNIAFMNEIAMVMTALGIRTADVLSAMNTKWNAMKFTPGLVGGHCIGVDPYYLTSRAEQMGNHLDIIMTGRRINDGMGEFIAKQTVHEMIQSGLLVKGAKVGLLGITFKENVPDLRNSRVPDIIKVLEAYGVTCFVHDAVADPAHVKHEYDLTLAGDDKLKDLDAVILTVAHDHYDKNAARLTSYLKPNGVMVDVKSRYQPDDFPAPLRYWSL
ncbi:MAG TPA: nucleotide sugar dehydrogenase [Alphaproteobacteria bacterium]